MNDTDSELDKAILGTLEVLPDGPYGDRVITLDDESISLSDFNNKVSFAVYLDDDSFPTKTYGYHFTNVEEHGSFFGRNIENELSEIYWYSPKKCIVLSGLVSASIKAHLTIVSPCVIGHEVTFKNIEQVTLIDRIIEELSVSGPQYSKSFKGKILLSNLHVETLNSQAHLILLNQTFIQSLQSRDTSLELYNEGIINNITMSQGDEFISNSNALIDNLNIATKSVRLLNEKGTTAGRLSLHMSSFENKGPLISTSGDIFLEYLGLGVFQNKELLKSNNRIHIKTVTQFENNGWIESANGGLVEAMAFINAENSVLMFRDKPLKVIAASQSNVLLSSGSTVVVGSLEVTDPNNARITSFICQGCDLTVSGVSGENTIKAQLLNIGIGGSKTTTTQNKDYKWAECHDYWRDLGDLDYLHSSALGIKSHSYLTDQIISVVEKYQKERIVEKIDQIRIADLVLDTSCAATPGCFPLCIRHTEHQTDIKMAHVQGNAIREPKFTFKSTLNLDAGNIKLHASKIHMKSVYFLSQLTESPQYIAEIFSKSFEIPSQMLTARPMYYSGTCGGAPMFRNTCWAKDTLAPYKWEWIAQDFGLDLSSTTVENLGTTHRVTQVNEIKEAAIYREDVVDGAVLEGMLGLIKQGTMPALPDVPSNALVAANERNALANRMHSLKFFDFKEQKQWVRTLSDGSKIVTSVPDVKLLFKMDGGGFNVEWLPRDLTLMEQENLLALSLTPGQLLTEWSVHYLVDIQSKYKPYLLRDSAGKEYFDQVAFLQSLDLEYDKEVLPISMNSFMLEKLLNKAIVETVGVLTGESTSETLRLFANNAFNQYKTHNIGLKAGKFLTDVQISLLEDPIIWPVFTNCWSGSTVIPCLSYQIYFNNRLIEEIVDDATGLVLSGRVLDLRTDQLVIPWLVKLKGSEQVKLSVNNHVVILGSLEGHDVNAEIKGELINLGKVKSTKDIAINAARIFLTNKVQAGEKLSIYAVEDLLIETLSELASVTSPYLGYRSTEQKVTVKATIEAGIDATLKSGKNTLITGAKIIGNRVLLQSNGKTAIVPLELYLEVIKWGHKFYYEYQRVTPVLTEITCGDGNFDIESQDDITVIGPNIQGRGEATWKSINGAVNVEAASIKEKSFQVTQGKKGLLGKTKRTEKTFFETPIQSTINFIGTFFTHSYESQRWIGIHIKAKQVRLNAGTPEHVAHISMLPAYKMSEIEVHTRSKSFKLGFEKGSVTFAEVVKSGHAKKLATPFPTIIQVEEELVVYAQGKFLYLQPHVDYVKETDEKGKIKIIVNAKDIELERAPEIEAEYIYHNKAGNGIGFKAKGGEFAIKSSVYHEQSKESWLRIRHPIAPIVRGFVEFNGDTIKDAGIYYFAEEMNLHSKIEVHTVVSDVETRKRVDSLFEAGMKFGIRSNVVSIKNTAKGITQDDHGSVEGVISSAFRGWKLYHDVLKLFSSNANFGISGGLWFFVHGEYSKSESRAVTEIPSILNVTKLNSTSDELSFKGTQVTAYEAYIETKYAKSDAAKSTYDASSKRGSFDLDIPVYGNVPASLSAEISKGKVKIEKNLRTQIYVSGRCKLDVSIRADLKGFSLSARELEANFNDLVLESLQDIIESKAWGVGVGIGLDGKDMPKLDNIKGSLQDRSMHVVESLSEILGSDPEKTKIVVANALRLNGAIVANAEKDENGNYTDHGNLVLTVGYLFIKHIYDYDRGKTLSASFSMGSDIKLHDQKGKDIPFMSLEATLAGHDKDGYTRATIGKSNNITITGNPEELEKANRDLSKVQTWNTHYDIKEIFLYYSNIDTKALKAGIPDTPEAWVKGVSQYVKSTLLPNSQSNVVLTEEQLEAIKAKAEENIQKLKNKAKNLSKKDKTEITEHNEKQISEVNKVKQELDHIQNDYASGKITEKSAKTKILENTAELIRDTGAKYVEFAEKHPTLAEYGLSG